MKVSITGVRSELGGILARVREPGGTENFHINVAGQQANTLLHDGHAWKDFTRIAFAGTRRAMRSARADGAPMLVHASFAFVHAIDRGTPLPEPLRARSMPSWNAKCRRCRVRFRPASCASAIYTAR